jgi:transposase
MSLIDQVALSRQAKHRLRQIIKMRTQGMSMEDIGLALNISKQRVSQVLNRRKNNGEAHIKI